jgi:hypothetical protein
MGLIDKLKAVLGGGRGDRAGKRSSKSKPASRGDVGNLPGGGSAKEAAEANPQRAGELAD